MPILNRVSSSKEIVNNILDFSKITVLKVDRRTKIDHDFIEKLKNLKSYNGVLGPEKQKKYFEEETMDKILLYHKVDTNMHLKID
jgi:hypothetical protein